jgi:hypothetical protein
MSAGEREALTRRRTSERLPPRLPVRR